MRIIRITTEIDLQAALEIRKTVFIEEQQVPESDEFDQFDTLEEQCGHVLVYHENQPAGTGRVRIVNHTGKLERICILKPYRKYGLGKVIISELENMVKEKASPNVNCMDKHMRKAFITNWAIRQIHRNLWKTASRMS